MGAVTNIDRRDPREVMRLDRLGSLHQTRLSFMRILLRRLHNEKWKVLRPVFDINESGVGRAIYTIQGPLRAYSLVAFAHDLPDSKRSDRVIADAWDTTFCLFDGIPNPEDVNRLEKNVPLQEAGRIGKTELCLSRANRSVRLWSYVVNELASGKQPELDEIQSVGYLMRTTAVYGSGKFGAADRETISDRAEMQAPFQAEMLTVYLIRNFVRDLIEHVAKTKGGPQAVALNPAISRQLGIGNSTGLGMAPFIINHPILFNNWISAREEAISTVRSLTSASEQNISLFCGVLKLSEQSIQRWKSTHPLQMIKLQKLQNDVMSVNEFLVKFDWSQTRPWDQLVLWASQTLTMEGQEWLNSLILEPFGELLDTLESSLADNDVDSFFIDGGMTVADTLRLIENHFAWAIELDWSDRENVERAWYISEEKLEPRIGNRFIESLDEYEQPLAPARDAVVAYQTLLKYKKKEPVATFLLEHPEHRQAVRRAQMCRSAAYGEIQDNTIAANLMPINMLRAKLSFFGATHFDPRSDQWVRIAMFTGAPYAEELETHYDDLWVYKGV